MRTFFQEGYEDRLPTYLPPVGYEEGFRPPVGGRKILTLFEWCDSTKYDSGVISAPVHDTKLIIHSSTHQPVQSSNLVRWRSQCWEDPGAHEKPDNMMGFLCIHEFVVLRKGHPLHSVRILEFDQILPIRSWFDSTKSILIHDSSILVRTSAASKRSSSHALVANYRSWAWKKRINFVAK